MRSALLLALLLALAACDDRPTSADPWVWLDNGSIRLGVLRTSGAAIGWLSEPGGVNLVNHHDRGRLIQQSWYGDPDGSEWNGKPWVWNPVQGGDWRGTGSRVLALEATATTIYARTLARHWAACVDLPDVVFEQWVTLDGASARVRYRMTYSGARAHAPRQQEAPAVFVSRALDTLVTAQGWWVPEWPNEYLPLLDGWAAWIDREGRGVGVLALHASDLTCYRWQSTAPDGCSYLAPVVVRAVTPGVHEYEVILTVGKLAEIRSVADGIRAEAAGAGAVQRAAGIVR